MDRRKVQYGTLNEAIPTHVGASQTDAVVSKACTIYDPCNLRIDVLVTAATNTSTTARLKLQQSPGPDHTGKTAIWTDVKSVSLTTGATDKYYTILVLSENSGDDPFLPLAEQVRVVCDTGAGDSVVINRITVLS